MLAAKIVKRRRRRDSPLKRRGFPRVLRGFLAFEHAPEQVKDEDQLSRSRDKGGDRHELVQANDMRSLQEGNLSEPGVAADITVQPQKVHGLKDAVSPDEGEPEVDLPPELVHHATEHLGKPKVGAAEHSEDGRNPHDQMEMSYHEVGGVQISIHGRLG